jgi:LCP family protein required for cell wall assembly
MRPSSLRNFLRRRRKAILASLAGAVALVVAGGLIAGYVAYRKVADEVHHVTVKDLGNRPPVYSTDSENILVVGSDSRAGLDHHQQVLLHTGADGGNNTDTIMLLHVSPGRHLVTVMSIPRDTMVPYYQCDSGAGYPGQQDDPYDRERINAVLAAGGPSCLWKTVEQQTGVYIDHFVMIGMAGFVNVVNDLGGVTVCVPFAVNDQVSGLDVPAGEQHIDGVTALAFWRTREDLGEGSDLQRIQRDQFMSAQVVKAILGRGLLSDPLRLLQVAGDLAPNLTVDSGMSTSDLVSLGASLHGLTAKDVQFVTAPVTTWPLNPNEVEFAQPAASAMFAAIARDATLPKGIATATASPSATGPALDVSPSATPVATGTATSSAGPQAVGAAKAAATPTPATSGGATSGGATPGTAVPGAAGPTGGATASASPSPSPDASPSGVGSLAAGNNGITGAAACTSDAGAFAGPNSP